MAYLNNPASTFKKQLDVNRLTFELNCVGQNLTNLKVEMSVPDIFSNREWVFEAYTKCHVLSLENIKVGKRKASIKGCITITSFYHNSGGLFIDLIGVDVCISPFSAKKEFIKEKVVFT